MIIYVYSNETGKQVDAIEGQDNAECERLAADKWSSNDYHYSYCDTPTSNAVTEALDVESYEIDGRTIQVDASGNGNTWVTVTELDARDDVDAMTEIAGEIIDGKRAQCDSYTAKNGLRYRWS